MPVFFVSSCTRWTLWFKSADADTNWWAEIQWLDGQ